MNETKKKKYVIYTRCSTDEQAQGDFTTLDAQAHHCKNMLDAFGYELASVGNNGIVNDDGYSGKDLNRPGIQMLLKSMHNQREFDGIIFFRLDRLTRNPRDLYAMIDQFREKNVEFVSVRENLDSSTAIGRVVIGILGLLSAFERELTGERVKASAIARARQGRRVGGTTPIGYKLIKDGDPLPNGKQPTKIIIDEAIAPYIHKVWEMTAENKSFVEIANVLMQHGVYTRNKNVWRRQGISLIVRNPFYKGYLRYSGELNKGIHEPIVNEKLWEKANAILDAKLPGRRMRRIIDGYPFLLAGLIKCGKCGSHLVCSHSAGRGKHKFFYYECSRSRQGLGCDYHRLSGPGFDNAVIDYLRRASANKDILVRAIGRAIEESRIKLEKVETQLKDTESKLNAFRLEADKLIDLAINNTIPKGPAYKTKLAGLETEIQRLEDEVIKLQDQRDVAQADASSGEFIHKYLGKLIEVMDKGTPETKKSVLRAVIRSIVLHEDTAVIDMFIKPEGCPELVVDLPPDTKNPTPTLHQDGDSSDTRRPVALTAPGSTERQAWGE